MKKKKWRRERSRGIGRKGKEGNGGRVFVLSRENLWWLREKMGDWELRFRERKREMMMEFGL